MVMYADLKRFYGVLNYLGSIPWKINPKVLEVVEQIWSEGGGKG
jgi:DNA-directed RNA polymerase